MNISKTQFDQYHKLKMTAVPKAIWKEEVIKFFNEFVSWYNQRNQYPIRGLRVKIFEKWLFGQGHFIIKTKSNNHGRAGL